MSFCAKTFQNFSSTRRYKYEETLMSEQKCYYYYLSYSASINTASHELSYRKKQSVVSAVFLKSDTVPHDQRPDNGDSNHV
jgi:hypothetical protein